MIGLKSFFLLGSKFWVHVFKRMTFLHNPGGADAFRKDFDPEGLLPLSTEDRSLLHSWQTCISCGACDHVCPASVLEVVPAEHRVGPQFIASTVLRDLSQYTSSYPLAASLQHCDSCSLCTDICPTEVPLKDLASFIVRVGEQARNAQE